MLDLDNSKDDFKNINCIISPYRNIIPYSQELLDQYNKEYEKWQIAYKQTLYELQNQGVEAKDNDEKYIENFK